MTDSTSHRLLRIFLCHASRDKDHVRQLYKQLRTDNFGPWLDEENLLPGQNWRREIPRAVRNSDVVLVCLSKSSISKSGYVHKEINLALDVAEEQPEGTIYIIPIRLEECEVPERLTGLQWVNLFEERAYEKLLQSLRYRAETLVETASEGSLIQSSAGKSGQQINAKEVEQKLNGLAAPKTEVHSNIRDARNFANHQTVDLGMEIGAQDTRILHKTRDILLTERSIVAINKRKHTVEAIGFEAESLSTSTDIVVNYPIRDDKIADPDLAAKMLLHFFHKVWNTDQPLDTRVVVAVPSEITQIERRAIVEAIYRAKVNVVYLVDRALCAALGAGLSIERTSGKMVVYVGESSTEVMAISHGRSVSFKTANVGISSMVEAITDYVQRNYNLLVGEHTAKAIWSELGSAYPLDTPRSMQIRGRNLIEGIPKAMTLVDEAVRDALTESISLIVQMVRDVLAQTPPEVSADIMDHGITLTGGGASLKQLDRRLEIESGVLVNVPEDPLISVVNGASSMLSNSVLLKKEAAPKPLTPAFIKSWNLAVGFVFRKLSNDLAIDIGAQNTLVYARGRGIVVSEPSMVAVNSMTYSLEAIGRDAKDMLGRTPGNIVALHPIKNGVIVNFEMAVLMLKNFIRKAHNRKLWAWPRVVIPVRSGLSRVERNALEEAAYRARASEVYIVDEAMCAAVGSGLPVTEPHANIIVDIGGSATDIAVISLAGIVYSHASRVAGASMDDAITQYIKRKYNLLIGERTAEAIKIEMGSAYPLDEPISYEVRGQNLIEGIPSTVVLTDEEVREALEDSVRAIVTAVRVALQKIPPELSADLVERGIVLTGGAALLQNMDKRLSIETGLPIALAEDPYASVILGAGRMLRDFDLLKGLSMRP